MDITKSVLNAEVKKITVAACKRVALMQWGFIPLNIFVLTMVNIVNQKSCGCKSNVVSGINIMTGIQIILAVLFIKFQDSLIMPLVFLWQMVSFINIILYFVFFGQIKKQNCECYRKYKGLLITLLVLNVISLFLR
jgi:hypothetical protein